MLSTIRPALVLLVLFTVLTGLAYPLAVTGVAQIVMPDRANGSLIERDGRIVGSVLLGQGFTGPQYFHPRPSAAGKAGYDAANSGGSNLAPSAKALVERVANDAASYRKENGATSVPMDAATASGSGLDPHISPANALLQVKRVAATRGMPEGEVATLVEEHTNRPWLNLLGMPSVNVLLLNLALDEQKSNRR